MVRATYQPQPHGITKEEFGVNLYETIKTIGGILGIDRQRAAVIHGGQGYKLADLNTRRQALQRTLAQQLQTLTDAEMAQVLEKYPWVVAA
jgi:2-C-methyl-D-erythritol 4-phosphate cytidylyltransferase